jgi:hypothetical protein
VARFTCPSGSLGDVSVELHEAGLVVMVERMWHGHFDEGSPEEMVADCADFLEDLFDDRVVIWAAYKDGRGLGGGTIRPDVAPGSGFRRLSRLSDDFQAGTWSGPWIDRWPDPFADGALADLARSEIALRFGDPHPEIADGWALPGPASDDTRVAAFACPTPPLGGVVVEADDFRVVVRVVGIWYRLFDQGTPEAIAGACGDFLEAFFDDKIVAWIARHGERRLGAGFFLRRAGDARFRRVSLEADDVRARTWTAPWADDA